MHATPIEQKVPSWTPEDRRQDKRREELRQTKPQSQKADKPKPAVIKPIKSGEGRRHAPSSVRSPSAAAATRRELKAKCKSPRREADKSSKKAAEEEEAAALGLNVAPVGTVNVNDAADPPCPVPQVRAFAPELDNVLLRSLLYETEHTHVIPLEKRKKWKPRGAAGGGEAAEVPTTGTVTGDQGVGTDANGRRALPLGEPEAEKLGALTAHLPLSPRAGKRPKLDANGDTRRLGAPVRGVERPGPSPRRHGGELRRSRHGSLPRRLGGDYGRGGACAGQRSRRS